MVPTMFRITAGVSLCLLATLGGTACSSTSKDEGIDKGGNGSVLTAGTSSTGGGGGTTGTTGGSSSGGSSGGRSNGGSSGTGTSGSSGAGDECANAPVVCLDANTASTCDPDTGMDITVKCKEDSMDLGIISSGCTGDMTMGTCSIDGFADQGCADGVAPFAVCGGYTQADALDIYLACYENSQGTAHDVIPCFAMYVDEAAKTVDCAAAEAACFPPE
jgi:hypothetical protein